MTESPRFALRPGAAALALALIAAGWTAQAQPRAALNGDHIAAVVNQELVTAGEVERRVERALAEAARAGGLTRQS